MLDFYQGIDIGILAIILLGIPANFFIVGQLLISKKKFNKKEIQKQERNKENKKEIQKQERNKENKKETDYFVLSMALADFFYLLLKLPSQVSSLRFDAVWLPSFLCPMQLFVGNVCYLTSNLSFYSFLIFRASHLLWRTGRWLSWLIFPITLFNVFYPILHFSDYLWVYRDQLTSVSTIHCSFNRSEIQRFVIFRQAVFNASLILYAFTSLFILVTCIVLLLQGPLSANSRRSQVDRRRNARNLFLCYLAFTLTMGLVEIKQIRQSIRGISNEASYLLGYSRIFGYAILNPLLYGIYQIYKSRRRDCKEMTHLLNFKASTIITLDSEKMELIGEGAFGKVYRFQEKKKWYALKVNTLDLDSEDSEAALKYYRLEEAIGESFRHANIVSYLRAREVHTLPQKTCVVLMEYCEHGDLKKLILKLDIIYSMRTVASWGAQLFRAIDYLFTKHKIVHRDIKPQNIFATADFTLKVGDFGCVKRAPISRVGSSIGTENYLAPQLDKRINGLVVSHKNDVYSMGLVLWEVIERKRFERKIDNPINPPNCTPAFQRLVSLCTNPDRKSRPKASNISSLFRDLEKSEPLRTLSYEPRIDTERRSLIRPIGFDGTSNLVPVVPVDQDFVPVHQDSVRVQSDSFLALTVTLS